MNQGISEAYRLLQHDENYDSAWKNSEIPERQYRRVVANELESLRHGEDILPYRVALECMKALPEWIGREPSLLDVGASSSYYYEVFKCGGFACDYTGLDYSEHFKSLAESLYPGIKFDVGDAINLPYADASFDVVFHSACIMHIRDYKKAMTEAVRVSNRFVIFHRTPIEERRGTLAYVKEAYGVPCMEWHFSPTELRDIFDSIGLNISKAIDLFLDKDGYGHRSYVCEKR